MGENTAALGAAKEAKGLFSSKNLGDKVGEACAGAKAAELQLGEEDAVDSAKEAYDAAKDTGDSSAVVAAVKAAAAALSARKEQGDAISFAESAQSDTKDKATQASILRIISNIHLQREDYGKAVQAAKDA